MEPVGGCMTIWQSADSAAVVAHEITRHTCKKNQENRTGELQTLVRADQPAVRAVRQKLRRARPSAIYINFLGCVVQRETSNHTSDGGNRPMSFPRMRRQKKFTSARRGSLCLREHATVSAAWRSANGIPNNRLRLKKGEGGALDTRLRRGRYQRDRDKRRRCWR